MTIDSRRAIAFYAAVTDDDMATPRHRTSFRGWLTVLVPFTLVTISASCFAWAIFR